MNLDDSLGWKLVKRRAKWPNRCAHLVERRKDAAFHKVEFVTDSCEIYSALLWGVFIDVVMTVTLIAICLTMVFCYTVDIARWIFPDYMGDKYRGLSYFTWSVTAGILGFFWVGRYKPRFRAPEVLRYLWSEAKSKVCTIYKEKP